MNFWLFHFIVSMKCMVAKEAQKCVVLYSRVSVRNRQTEMVDSEKKKNKDSVRSERCAQVNKLDPWRWSLTAKVQGPTVNGENCSGARWILAAGHRFKRPVWASQKLWVRTTLKFVKRLQAAGLWGVGVGVWFVSIWKLTTSWVGTAEQSCLLSVQQCSAMPRSSVKEMYGGKKRNGNRESGIVHFSEGMICVWRANLKFLGQKMVKVWKYSFRSKVT